MNWIEYLRDGRKQSVEEVQRLLAIIEKSLDDFADDSENPIPVRTGPDAKDFEQYFRGADITFRNGRINGFKGVLYTTKIEPLVYAGICNEDVSNVKETPIVYRGKKQRHAFNCKIR